MLQPSQLRTARRSVVQIKLEGNQEHLGWFSRTVILLQSPGSFKHHHGQQPSLIPAALGQQSPASFSAAQPGAAEQDGSPPLELPSSSDSLEGSGEVAEVAPDSVSNAGDVVASEDATAGVVSAISGATEGTSVVDGS